MENEKPLSMLSITVSILIMLVFFGIFILIMYEEITDYEKGTLECNELNFSHYDELDRCYKYEIINYEDGTYKKIIIRSKGYINKSKWN